MSRRLLPSLLAVALVAVMLVPLAVSARQASTPPPQGYRGSDGPQGYRGAFTDLVGEIDAFWAASFEAAGTAYASPDIVVVDRPLETACGPVEPVPNAFYCPLDRTVYLVPQFLVDQETEFGDYAPIAVLAHEWGHHVQALLGIRTATTKPMELQADCLLGVFTAHADETGLLDYGDFLEALDSAIDVGDPLGLPEDHPGAHGAPEERVKALTRGFGGGAVVGCALPLGDGAQAPNLPLPPDLPPGPEAANALVLPQPVAAYLPGALPMAHAACFRIEDGGALGFDELVGRLAPAPDAAARLTEWGWQESAFLVFACDDPPPGGAGYVDVGLHLFADGPAAQSALPYFAAARAGGTTLLTEDGPPIGDASVLLSGPVSNGTEATLYATVGPMLVRASAISPSGEPRADVAAVARQVVTVAGPMAGAAMNAAAYLPGALLLPQMGCFRVEEGLAFDLDGLAATFPDPATTADWLRSAGWRDGARLTFACDDPPVGGAGWVQVSVHRFADASGAQGAADRFAEGRASGSALRFVATPTLGDYGVALAGPVANGTEVSIYASSGPLLIRVTGVSPSGEPTADVQAVLRQVLTTAS
ncbi:MAG: neutral zinc metallopeptidase [Chloroflexia bacterium]|nr:neutral zinc metallopeptidase [Chloroflexia bacterium]